MTTLKKDLIRDLDILKARYDQQYVDRQALKADKDRLTAEVELLRKENERLDKIADSEHALRCIRMPYLDEQVRLLKEQLERAANLCAERRTQYEYALTALKDVIQHHQAEPTNFHAYLKGERE